MDEEDGWREDVEGSVEGAGKSTLMVQAGAKTCLLWQSTPGASCIGTHRLLGGCVEGDKGASSTSGEISSSDVWNSL